MMSTIAEQLRGSMRKWLTGVTVVTASADGIQHGMTVSSFTSVSLDPAQILISLQQNSRTHDLIMRSRSFGISVLAANQEDISNIFAGRKSDDEDRLAGLETFTMKTGAPFINGCLAFFDCKVVTTIGSGTHTIFIAEVLDTRSIESDEDPLIYYNREYKRLSKD